jgi:hypothetical protein
MKTSRRLRATDVLRTAAHGPVRVAHIQFSEEGRGQDLRVALLVSVVTAKLGN